MSDADKEELIPLRPVQWIWLWGIVGVLALGAGAVWLMWDQIPDPMPAHWGPRGEPDRFVEKTVLNVVGVLGVSTLVLALVAAFVLPMVRYQAAHAHEGLPRPSTRMANRTRAMANEMGPLVGRLLFGLSVLIVLNLIPSLMGRGMGVLGNVILVGGIVASVAWILLAARRAQARVDRQFPHPDPNYQLKWGLFYYNPEDPRLLIDDSGMNTTFNFAHKGAWAILAGLLVPAAVVVALGIALG